MEVFYAAIIGAGADGLAAAALLSRAGLKTIVIERNARAGGRLATKEFHPGFRASVYADEIAPIPPELFWSLDLARRGALFMPQRRSLALWSDRSEPLESGDDANALARESQQRAAAMLARAEAELGRPQALSFLAVKRPMSGWPSEDWADASLINVLETRLRDQATVVQLASRALAGRAADPGLAGSALHLLAPGTGSSGICRGGMGTFAAALEEAAREAGARFSFGLEVTDIRRARGRVAGVCLADGVEIGARAVISTLDLKRTFLALFSWTSLPAKLVNRVNGFRMAAGTARLLLALHALPERTGVSGLHWPSHGPVHIAPDLSALRAAFAHWRNGALADALPLTVRFPSVTDPSLAPEGAATMTVTIGAVPHRLFDGAWTNEKRAGLRERVLARIETVLPGLGERVLGSELIVPPDIEEALGLTDGDLDGGEIAPDQMLWTRPWSDGPTAPRTPIAGLYLAGPSTTAGLLATCASGAHAARAVLEDLTRSRWFR